MSDPYAGFDSLIGLSITSATADEVVATLTVTPEHHQPYGLVHGGVMCSIVETVCSVGAAMWFGDRGKVVGANNNTHLLRGVREGVLTAVATPVHRGSTQQLWTVDIRDEQDRLVSQGQLRVANLAAG